MKKTILIGGKAGQGIDKTATFLGRILSNVGYYSFIYRDYPSLIRGGHNFDVLTFSDQPVYSHEDEYDIIMALDQETVSRHEKDLKKKGFIVGEEKIENKKVKKVNLQNYLSSADGPRVLGNNVLIGALVKEWGVPLKEVSEAAADEFSSQTAKTVIEGVKAGYEQKKEEEKITLFDKKDLYFFNGSQGVARGAVAGGLDVYFAYPMTPATGVLHELAKHQKEDDILVSQVGNEIAVANAALGSSYTGAQTMLGTSGGGFALMSEAMSLAGMAELPLVAYLAQRTSPASGVPTYSSQGDLKFALNVGHGEFPRIVVASGDPEEAFQRTQEAFYLAAKYNTLAILMSDKHIAESYYSFEKIKESRVKNNDFVVKEPAQDYQSYRVTEDGVSPRAVPGQGPFVRANSYEHDEYGYTTEEAEMTTEMNDKRWRKAAALKKDVLKLDPVQTYGQGSKLLVGWGSTKGALRDVVAEKDNYRFLQISYIEPFPAKEVKKELEKAEQVILVENNVTGLLGQVIREKTGFLIKDKILRYDARPFTANYIISKLKQL